MVCSNGTKYEPIHMAASSLDSPQLWRMKTMFVGLVEYLFVIRNVKLRPYLQVGPTREHA